VPHRLQRIGESSKKLAKTRATPHQPKPAHGRFPTRDSIVLQMRIALFGLRKTFMANLASHGVPWKAWYYLRILWEEDGLSQIELTRRIGTMQPNAAATLKAMERLGLVRIERASTGRRAMRVWVTEKSRELEAVMLPQLSDTIEGTALSGFTAAEIAELQRLLAKVCANVASSRAE
jgi:DNA-binding MarR family transcriptional regulator